VGEIPQQVSGIQPEQRAQYFNVERPGTKIQHPVIAAAEYMSIAMATPVLV